MPTVPDYGPRKVDPERLPDARQTGPGGAVETPESAGAGVGAVLTDLGQVGLKLSQQARAVVEQARERAATIRLRDADQELAAFELDRRFASDGWLTRRGVDSLGVREQVDKEMTAKAAAIRDSLRDDRLRTAFDGAAQRRVLDAKRWADEYSEAQVNEHDDQQHRSYVDTAVQNGIANSTDLARVAAEAERIIDETTEWGRRHGWAAEAIGAEARAHLTTLHTGVIHQLLAADREADAAAYFAGAKDQINGAAQPQLVAALDEGTLRRQSQIEADRILAAGGDIDTQRAAARTITDAKLRDAVMDRVEHEATFQARKAAAAYHDVMLGATNTIDKTGNWRSVPSGDWVSLTVDDRAALKRYAEQMTAGTEVKTDPNTYYYLSMLATAPDPELRKQFLQTNILSFVDRLSPTDRKHFMDAQGAARQGDANTAIEVFSDAAQQNRIVDEALISMDLDPTPLQPGAKGFDAKNAERTGMFRQSVREAVTRLELAKGGKKATDAEVQAIADQLRTPTGPRLVSKGGVFTRDVTAPGYAFETAQAQAAQVSDIPASERRRVEQALRDSGRSVNDHNVLLLFNLNLARTRKDLGPEDFAQRRRAVLLELDDFDRRRRDLGAVVDQLPR